jgi:hypothetical protein
MKPFVFASICFNTSQWSTQQSWLNTSDMCSSQQSIIKQWVSYAHAAAFRGVFAPEFVAEPAAEPDCSADPAAA